VIEQPMKAGNADVVQSFDLATRALGGDRRLLRHWQIRGSSGDDEHAPEARPSPPCRAPRDASLVRVADAGQSLRQSVDIRRLDARNHHVVASRRQALCDLDDLRARLSLREDHFREALTKRAMVVDLGEPQVFVREVSQLVERAADAPCTATNVLEKSFDALGVQPGLVIAGCTEAEKQVGRRRSAAESVSIGVDQRRK